MLLIIGNMNIYGLGAGSELFPRYLGLHELVGPGHVAESAPKSRYSNFKLSCKTIYQFLSYTQIRKIPSVVNEK